MKSITVSESDLYIALTAMQHIIAGSKDQRLVNIMVKAQQGIMDAAFESPRAAEEFILRYSDYFNASLKPNLSVVADDPHVEIYTDDEGKVFKVGADGTHTRIYQPGDVSFAGDPDGYIRRGEE